MSEKQKVVVQINGNKYPITTAEDVEYVNEMAKEIDRMVHQLMDDTHLSMNEALVLISLSYLDAYKKSEQSADHLRGQVAEYLEEASKARIEAAGAKQELERLESRVKGKEAAAR